jgi:hypothetical protein
MTVLHGLTAAPPNWVVEDIPAGTFRVNRAALIDEAQLLLVRVDRQQVEDSCGRYKPWWHYENEPEICAVLNLLFSVQFSRREPGLFAPIRHTQQAQARAVQSK